MSATETLVAEWGIEAVNLRDVGREADQRNNSVVQYHFGTKEILVGAVIDARMPVLHARFRALLDELEQSGRLREPGALASVLVDPLLELARSEEDHHFLGFMAAMLTAPHWQPLLVDREDFQLLFRRVVDALIVAGVPAEAAPSRLRLAWMMSVVALPAREGHDLSTVRAELVDAVSGLLGTSVEAAGSGRR